MKAVVLDVKGSRSVVILKDGTVRTVKRRYSIGQEVRFDKPASFARRLAAAAAAVAVMAAGCFWFDQNLVACAEVSIDVNPSIVYTLNRRSRVISVRAENEEAESLVQSLTDGEVLFSTLPEALEKTFELLKEDGYLQEDQQDFMLVGIATDSENALTQIRSEVTASLQESASPDESLTYVVTETGRKDAKKAKRAHVSPGRYSAWQQATDADESAFEDFRSMNVKDIVSPPPKPDAPDGDRGMDFDGPAPQDGAPEEGTPFSADRPARDAERDGAPPALPDGGETLREPGAMRDMPMQDQPGREGPARDRDDATQPPQSFDAGRDEPRY